jgi:hypothetical protein
MKFETYEEINAKAEELTKSHGTKVHAFTALNGTEDDKVVAFIKEPSRLIKSRAMDKTYGGMGFTAGGEMLEACIIKEESDPRILSEAPEYDKFYLGAAKFCADLLIISTDNTKKN